VNRPYNHLLPTEAQRDRLQVVLVSPRNPLNIGAAARAMANFGFSRLAVVAPYAPHWREAQAAAIGASDLLQNAKVSASLAEALADCTLVAGAATLARRKPAQPVVLLPALAPLLQSELARGGRAALVFGPEKHGLTRADLSHCHLLVEIPTQPRQPSMNLGQAVAVCLYELSTRMEPGAVPVDAAAPAPAPGLRAASGELDFLAGVIDQIMAAADYSPAAMRAANRLDLRLLLRRLALSAPDARRILGLSRKILWRLEHRPNRKTG
jgi:TrmH family RNA methyltransferase